jgi:pectinesterase
MVPIVAKFSGTFGGNLRVSSAIKDCLELFDLSSDELSWSTSSCNSSGQNLYGAQNRQFDLQSWLSAALSNQGTCKESLVASGSILASMISTGLETVTSLVSRCLSQVTVAAGTNTGVYGRSLVEGFPQWTKSKDRKLLHDLPQGTANAVVAQDGSGQYNSVSFS